jgi:toxin ParE1/3/4
VKLRFRSAAQSDIARIFDYLDGQSPQARQKLEANLRLALDLLVEFLLTGHATTRPGVRRLLVTSHPYAVFYRVSGDVIVVISVRHTARRPLAKPPR